MAATEQLMYQYGVAWFGFDESSGNVIDKLGNGYVGTVTNATRIQGWNGEGSAMNFSGTNQYITVNNTTLPVNEKTMKFKLKTNINPPYSSWILSNIASNTIGTCIRLTGDGKIYTSSFNSSYSYILLISNGNVVDGKWHDIIISYGKYISIYIDGELDSKIINNFNYGIPTGAMRIGASASATPTDFLNGQIDDLQIYNKALSPSDFTQKRLIVKTSDNKNLVLSPTSTRVKEIPNTAENMMLAQGGVVKEIDSAVDRPPIDFTKPTTEYEIVTNNRTPLGKGRLFTIPINSDFKTIIIEDNY